MEFKAELKGKELIVKPIIERKGNNVIVHVPSFPLINKLIKEQNGVRNIQ
jgi:hypothetical protein